MRVAMAAVAALVACGGRQPKPLDRFETDPMWASSYEQRAAAGCQCRDAACLERARGELLKIETAHGGMDDAPPGVQKAHGDFDRCWRDGTKDPTRDVTVIADEVCGCADAACLRQVELDKMHLVGKYEVGEVGEVAAQAPGAQQAWTRAQKCIDDVTIPGPAFVDVVAKAQDAVCQCDNLGCAQSVMKDRTEAVSKYLQVGGIDGVQQTLDALTAKFCHCLGELVTKEMSGSIMNPFPMKIDASIDCK